MKYSLKFNNFFKITSDSYRSPVIFLTSQQAVVVINNKLMF